MSGDEMVVVFKVLIAMMLGFYVGHVYFPPRRSVSVPAPEVEAAPLPDATGDAFVTPVFLEMLKRAAMEYDGRGAPLIWADLHLEFNADNTMTVDGRERLYPGDSMAVKVGAAINGEWLPKGDGLLLNYSGWRPEERRQPEKPKRKSRDKEPRA